MRAEPKNTMVPQIFSRLKACIGAIKKSDAGSIINVGGLTGAMGAPDRVHVVTAKAGIAGFTRGLAMELSSHKITAWPSDIAPLARFLVGPGARYITGQLVNVNGGTYFH